MNRIFPWRTVWNQHPRLLTLAGVLILLNVATYLVNDLVITGNLNRLTKAHVEKQLRLRTLSEGSQTGKESPLVRAQQDLARFRQALPQRRMFPEFMEEIFSLAQSVGLEIETVSYNPEPLEEFALLRYVLTFSVAGEYGQIKRLIHALEQSPRMIGIEQISLVGDQPFQDLVKLQLRLSTYFDAGVDK